MGRAARSTAGKLDVVVLDLAVVDDDADLPVAAVGASVVAGLPALLQETRKMAASITPPIAGELLR